MSVWKSLIPVRNRNHPESSILTDIDCQLGNDIYKDADLVTWGHEGTHGVNSRCRGIEGSAKSCIYVCGGWYGVCEDGSKLLSEVAYAIPPGLRKMIYQLYCVDQQRWWQNATYLFDEAVAYQNGTLVGIEIKDEYRTNESFAFALEMNVYCAYMAKLCDSDDVTTLFQFLCTRNGEIMKRLKTPSEVVKTNYQDLMTVLGRTGMML